MVKYVHVWRIHCNACNSDFEHVFQARDILRPHIFNELLFTCPSCGAKKFDLVRPEKKETLEQWKADHPETDLKDVPDYSHLKLD
ncbi:MAG: Zn-ribbon domain-containing protein [Candidatus Thermoplasmatota archaeon]|nr:Zn-ribbon domain-containing protein [Candidatus Thermoplasmatota archaeon]